MQTRYFALGVGVIYLLVGLVGFLATGTSMAAGDDAPRLMGLFPVNVLHNIVHLIVGGLGIAAYRSYDGARGFARGLAIFYGLLAIMGLLPDPFRTTFGLIPIFGHDVWLHALTALVAAYFGFAAQREGIETIDASRRR
jgi:hypothetical protein